MESGESWKEVEREHYGEKKSFIRPGTLKDIREGAGEIRRGRGFAWVRLKSNLKKPQRRDFSNKGTFWAYRRGPF